MIIGYRSRRIAWSLVAVMAVGTVEMTARADVSDVVWTALKEREIAVETAQGEVRGKLAGVDAKNVVLLKSDGTPVTISRATVKSVHAVVPESAPSATPSAAASAPPTAAPVESAAPAAPPLLHPEIEKMVNNTVIVWMTNGDRVLGRLTDTDAQNIAVRTGQGLKVLPRRDIDNIARWAPMPSSQSDSDQGASQEGERGAETQETSPDGEKLNTRGLWVSMDTSVLGFLYQWNEFGNGTAFLFGPAAATYNFGLGYQTSESFLIGTRFGFQTLFAEGSDTVFLGRFAARFEALFGHSTTRGFFAFEPGLVTAQVNNDTAGAFSAAISLGAHIFASDGFSIDPFGEMSYQRVFDVEINTFALRGGIMLSGWSWSKPRR